MVLFKPLNRGLDGCLKIAHVLLNLLKRDLTLYEKSILFKIQIITAIGHLVEKSVCVRY